MAEHGENQPLTPTARRQRRPRPQVERRAFTIEELCDSVGISVSFYHKLKNAGKGPVETHLLEKIVITDENADAWLRVHQRDLERETDSAA